MYCALSKKGDYIEREKSLQQRSNCQDDGEAGYLEPQVYCSAQDIELAREKISDGSERSTNAASPGDFGSWLVGESKWGKIVLGYGIL
ncbi:hypothetical protein CEXT_560411 [Caerostris extrusa]|uniref:Uncharacterized protein n=1 Tax=Caerostris extrusa TaxID=172846 RepID=A0AAV4MLB0_CAEEX|nr:hypothetical protein CEXT_560411 [Caerostris extrusa]